MKTIFFSLILFFSAQTLYSQEKLHLHVGNTHQNVLGYKLLPDSLGLSESVYYNIVNGYFDYFFMKEYEGKILQFDHFYCPVDQLDVKSATYEVRENFTILKIKTINEEPEIMVYSTNVDGQKTSKSEFTADNLEIYIPNEEIGKDILKQIKKGKDL